MSYGELYIPPEPVEYRPPKGQFQKGHIPFNKGKKWDDFMGKRKQRKAMRGWKNLELYRPTSRPDNAGRCRKQVVGIMDDGSWLVFPYIGKAAEWVGGCRENVRRCCQYNGARKVCKRKSRQVNTDHKYKGVRFYYETDDIWISKIKQ